MPLTTTPSAVISAAGSHVDHKIRVADQVQIVLDDKNRCIAGNEPLEYRKKRLHIKRVQTDGWLVEDKKNGVLLSLAHLSASFSRCASPPDELGVASPSVR